jgi:Cu2+-containing amine oxidase
VKSSFFVISLLVAYLTMHKLLFAECPQDVFPPSCDTCDLSSTLPITLHPQHPLDPLTPTEQCVAVQAVTKFIQKKFPMPDPRFLFDRVELKQPPKSFVLAFKEGDPLKRFAFVAVYSPSADKYYTAEVNLKNGVINNWQHVPKARPSWTNVDSNNIYRLLNSDPRVIAALAKRGITKEQIDNNLVQWCVAIDGRLDNLQCANKDNLSECKAKQNNGCEQCAEGMPNLEGNPRPRSYYAMPFLLNPSKIGVPNYPNGDLPNIDPNYPVSNYYLQPISGIMVWLNENAKPCGKILKVQDSGVVPVQNGLALFNCPPNAYYNEYRGTLKPLQMCQPQGPSFKINGANCSSNCEAKLCGSGNEIIWEKWKFHFSMHPTWGLQLNLVSFNDKKNQSDPDNYRSILYQANLAEVITPYGSPMTVNHNFLDLGEYQTRLYITSLQRGIDVPPYATMLSPVFVQEDGTLLQYNNAFAIYEQDGGVLWRHIDVYTGVFQGRRARELVLTHTNVVGNYDYAFYWTFSQDGKIHVSVTLTGLDEYAGTNQTRVPPEDPYDPLVHANISGANHQHVFCYRLDFDVDGTENSVYESNTVATKSGKNNPCSNLWTAKETLLPTTKAAKRDINPFTSRRWIFRNPSSINDLGQSRGYALVPQTSAKRLFGHCSRLAKRAHFTEHNLFVTPFKDDQLYVMGKYPVEKGNDEGLRIYSRDEQNLVDVDLVAWYSMVFSHDPEPENFPILPAEKIGFSIEPSSFFSQNPSIDIDPIGIGCCKDCKSCGKDLNVCPQ